MSSDESSRGLDICSSESLSPQRSRGADHAFLNQSHFPAPQAACFSGPPFNCKERVRVYLGLWSHFRILSALILPLLLATNTSKKAGPVQSLSLMQENVDAILPEGVVISGNHNNYGIWLIIMTALSCLG